MREPTSHNQIESKIEREEKNIAKKSNQRISINNINRPSNMESDWPVTNKPNVNDHTNIKRKTATPTPYTKLKIQKTAEYPSLGSR